MTAACLGVTHLLFPEDPLTGEDLIDATPPEFCFTCPERRPCLIAGWDEKFGIWGGMNYAARLSAHLRGKGPEDCLPPSERTA